MQRAKRIQKGFTLLEILLVIAAIGLLAAIILVAINPNRQLAQVRNAERRSEINSIYKALEQYLIDTKSYPTGITTSIQDICINGNTTNCVNLGVLFPDYIAAIPIDPGGGAYRVVINTSNNRVSIYASNAELGQGIGINDRPWTPAQLGSSLALWLDAADSATVTLNGSNVSQWSDKSGRNNHVLNATAATQPPYLATGFNGKPTVNFVESSQSFLFGSNMSNFSSNNDFTLASAFEFLDPLNNWDMIAGWRAGVNTPAPGSPVFQGMGVSSQIGIHHTDLADTRIKVDVTTRLGKNIATISRLGGTNGNGGAVTATSTGFSQASYDTNATQTWESTATSNFQVGGTQQGGTAFGDKYISEIVGCSTKLSTDNRQKLEGYLAWKWGLTNNLPANHPYKWNGAEFGGVNITDTDAQTYIAAVETADGQSLENNTRLAIQNFIVGAKADGIWDAIKSSNILAGARTLNGALVPLKGTAPTNFNFASGDYNRKTGLVGDGSTKYLDSNRQNASDPQNSRHQSVYVSTGNSTVGTRYYAAGGEAGYTGFGMISSSNTLTAYISNVTTRADVAGQGNTTGFKGVGRSDSSTALVRSAGSTSSFTNASQAATSARTVVVFAQRYTGVSDFSNGRLAFYSIGESLDLAKLDTRVTQLMTDLGNAIP
jgi:prepilin-type N-terminal cleavage/methylation domain-containing protein